LFNLADFLPKKPTDEELGIIFEMFEASVDGQLYDPDRFGNYYRPYGLDTPSSANNTTAPVAQSAPAVATPAPAPAPVAEVVAEPVAETVAAPEGGEEKPSAQDILAMIRQRKES
jgi:hypothetical protein